MYIEEHVRVKPRNYHILNIWRLFPVYGYYRELTLRKITNRIDALLQTFTGVRYDNLSKTLYFSTCNISSYKTFLSTATGYGTIEVSEGDVKVHVVAGTIEVKQVVKQTK